LAEFTDVAFESGRAEAVRITSRLSAHKATYVTPHRVLLRRTPRTNAWRRGQGRSRSTSERHKRIMLGYFVVAQSTPQNENRYDRHPGCAVNRDNSPVRFGLRRS